MKSIVAILIICFSMLAPVYGQQEKSGTQHSKAVATESDVTSLMKIVSFGVLLQVEVDKLEDAYLNESYLLKFKNFLDYNVVGAGKSIIVDPDRISVYIVSKITEKVPHGLISDLLISELNQGAFNLTFDPMNRDVVNAVNVGGFLTTELEYFQEGEHGSYGWHFEINQAKIFINSQIISSEQNRINLLAEWNPVREDASDYADEFILPNGDTAQLFVDENTDHIPFERLSVTIENVAGSGVDITTGQIRNPFGFWSDYTSHRNFTATKNNIMVNGFALKKIELGIQIEKQFDNGLGFKTAIVHGRFGRNSSLNPREDNDHTFDLVTRLHYSQDNFTIGVSSYFSELKTDKRNAFGADFLFSKSNLSISGEFVYQSNQSPKEVYENAAGLPHQLSSHAGYVQYDLRLLNKLHFYGLYDYWGIADRSSFKAFHGIRYYINRNVKVTLAELGYIRHAYDKERDYHFLYATQLEVTF